MGEFRHFVMSLHNYLNRIERLDALIRQRRTGSPKELADKLEISERWLFRLLEELRMELNCPIRYCRRTRTYFYKRKGRIRIGFTEDEPEGLDRQSMQSVRGGMGTHGLTLQSCTLIEAPTLSHTSENRGFHHI